MAEKWLVGVTCPRFLTQSDEGISPGETERPANPVCESASKYEPTVVQESGSFCVIELTAFPHNGPPPHIHHREDESFYVLDGNFSFLLGDRTIEADPGFFCRVPKGTVHRYENVGTKPGKALVILTPAGFEKFFMELGRPVASLTGPTGPPDPESIAQLLAIAPKYGLEVKLP